MPVNLDPPTTILQINHSILGFDANGVCLPNKDELSATPLIVATLDLKKFVMVVVVVIVLVVGGVVAAAGGGGGGVVVVAAAAAAAVVVVVVQIFAKDHSS